MSKAIPLRVTSVQGYSYLNSPESLAAACKEHTNFTPDSIISNNLYVIETDKIRFDYSQMKHQPRIENKDDKLAKGYFNQAKNGAKVNGKFVRGIREPITVYSSPSRDIDFEGVLGHHRYLAAKLAEYEYIVAIIDDEFPLLPKHEQVDYLMSDNAGVSNQKASCAAACREALKEFLRSPEFMPKQKIERKSLQQKVELAKTEQQKQKLLKKLKKIHTTMRPPLIEKIKVWMPNHSDSYLEKMVTTALADWDTGFAKLYSHSKAERQEVVVGLNHEVYLDWGQKSSSNEVQINLPIAEFVKRVRAYLVKNNRLPKKFNFITHIPSGARDYRHLMELRKRTAESIEETITDLYPSVKREFSFLGQILKSNDWKEDPKKVYDLDYVNRFIASQ
tara:strand:- start:3293 stop:4465 length:1173 start_codon:yes stop_codon:yes gene_type:complete